LFLTILASNRARAIAQTGTPTNAAGWLFGLSVGVGTALFNWVQINPVLLEPIGTPQPPVPFQVSPFLPQLFSLTQY
jgi:hypothetical protein